MTVPSLPARFGHRTAPSELILTRAGGDNLCSDGAAGDREPITIAELIYSAGAEKHSVPNTWREIQQHACRFRSP
jgi:hypothetical protein